MPNIKVKSQISKMKRKQINTIVNDITQTNIIGSDIKHFELIQDV